MHSLRQQLADCWYIAKRAVRERSHGGVSCTAGHLAAKERVGDSAPNRRIAAGRSGSGHRGSANGAATVAAAAAAPAAAVACARAKVVHRTGDNDVGGEGRHVIYHCRRRLQEPLVEQILRADQKTRSVDQRRGATMT